jgi:nucleoside-diphosphate-sugar epimerase
MSSTLGAADVLRRDVEFVCDRASAELEALAGTNLLVTGGGGFLGYMLLHVLAQVGNGDGRQPIRLTVYENFRRGRRRWLDALTKRRNVVLVEHDVTQPMPGGTPPFDFIVHAASIASPTFYRQFPIETIDANVNGLRYLLDYARARSEAGRGLRGMLFFSTSEIYGDPSPDAIPTPETYRGLVSCTGPRACYDESKRLGETLSVNFAQQYGVPVAMARPFNNYGPGLDINDKRVLPDLARNIFDGQDLVLLSDGRATRTFCYIADAVVGYLKVLVKGAPGEPYNIGIEAPEISVGDVAARLAATAKELFGYRGKVVFKTSQDRAYLVDNPSRRCPDITKARTALGYNPEIDLDEGLRRSLLWYSENLS